MSRKRRKRLSAAKGPAYEDLIQQFFRNLVEQVDGLHEDSVRGGGTNRIQGASGYWHQIDVSIHTASELHLIECKCWDKKVSPDAVLTLAARMCDIKASLQASIVEGALATSMSSSPGVQALAKFFGITLQVVSSPQEFVVRYRDRIHLGTQDPVSVSDDAKVELTPHPCKGNYDEG
jgi:hypothetical protein